MKSRQTVHTLGGGVGLMKTVVYKRGKLCLESDAEARAVQTLQTDTRRGPGEMRHLAVPTLEVVCGLYKRYGLT